MQKELPGLRGFSYSNLKNMRQFFEEYPYLFQTLQLTGNEKDKIGQSSTGQLELLEINELKK